MLVHSALTDQALKSKVRRKEITLAGHKRARIYGLLSCSAGKRMARRNRVFFKTEDEALLHGLRPCGHCMPEAFRQWRARGISYENRLSDLSDPADKTKPASVKGA